MAIDWRILQNRFLRTLILSRLCVQVGVWVRSIAVLMFVMDKTGGDPFAVALISAAEVAPIFLFSIIGGMAADQFRSKRMMVLCDFLSGLSVLAVMAAMMSGAWKAVFFATLFSSVLSQFSEPASMKLYKQHVPPHQMQSSLALYQTLMAVFMLAGPLVGTMVYQVYGVDMSLAVMAGAFLLSAFVLSFLPREKEGAAAAGPEPKISREVLEGVRYVWRVPVLRWLGAVFMMVGLAMGLLDPIGVFIVTEQLGLPKEDMQWLMMSAGAGMVVGGLVTMSMAGRLRTQTMLTGGLLMLAISLGVVGYSTSVPLTLGARFLGGLCMPLIMSGINTIMIQHTNERYIGRANGVLSLAYMGTMTLAVGLSSHLMEMMSLSALMELATGLLMIGVLLSLPLAKHLVPPGTGEKPSGKWKRV